MSQLQRNVVANLAARVWSNLLNIALVPLYLKFLGIEAYGLVGIFLTLQTMSAYLDFGLGPATVRMIARLSIDEEERHRQRNLIRTMEVLYWPMGITLGVIIALLAPVIATQWVRAEHLSDATIARSIGWMGVAVAVQFPTAIYSGAIGGLQRQVLMNAIVTVVGTIRAAGAVIVLWLVSPTIEAFLIWQAICGALQTAAFLIATWVVLPRANAPARFDRRELREIWKFAVASAGLAATTALFLQADKIVLSKVLPLGLFGHYTLAMSLAGILLTAYAPIATAFYPRFSQLTKDEAHPALASTYHLGSQLVVALVLPATAVLVFFSHELIRVWTRSGELATQVATITALCGLGMMLLVLAELPNFLRLAFGWVSLSLRARLASVVLLVPVLVLGAKYAGVAGAAAGWCVVTFLNLIVTVVMMHRRVLTGELVTWAGRGLLVPLVATFGAGLLFRQLIPRDLSDLAAVLAVGTATALMFLICGATTPEVQRLAMARIGAWTGLRARKET